MEIVEILLSASFWAAAVRIVAGADEGGQQIRPHARGDEELRPRDHVIVAVPDRGGRARRDSCDPDPA